MCEVKESKKATTKQDKQKFAVEKRPVNTFTNTVVEKSQIEGTENGKMKIKAKSFKQDCERCGITYSSRSGYNKHVKEHKLADKRKEELDGTTVTENIVEGVVEDPGSSDYSKE